MLLGLSDTEELRKVFHQTDICRVMIRQLESDNINKELILQIMINISSDELFQNTLIDFNVIYRICTLLFNKLEGGNNNNNSGGTGPGFEDNMFDFLKDTEKKLDIKYST
jgi:hypothetical protein